MIPGSDLLNMAFAIIATQTVTYYAASGRTVNAVGQYVTTYAGPIETMGSFQPVSRAIYQNLGLDFQKSYYVYYLDVINVMDVERDVSPDLFVYNSNVYQAESNNDWFRQDNWKGILLTASSHAIPT